MSAKEYNELVDRYNKLIADKIISESRDTDEWYEYFDDFASLLNHPKSLVRNRVLYILAAKPPSFAIAYYRIAVVNENPFTNILKSY